MWAQSMLLTRGAGRVAAAVRGGAEIKSLPPMAAVSCHELRHHFPELCAHPQRRVCIAAARGVQAGRPAPEPPQLARDLRYSRSARLVRSMTLALWAAVQQGAGCDPVTVRRLPPIAAVSRLTLLL